MAEPVTLLPDLSDDAPSGENLEFDPDFSALDRACQGKPEAQYGDTIIPAVPPEWKEAQPLAESLLERTRDLRVFALYAMTRLNLDGLPGFADVVAQIRLQVEERWQSVHPQLDPEDDNDPTLRANALFRLQDPSWVMRVLRDMPLATTPLTGPVTWRDISIHEGSIEVEEGVEKKSEAFIRGAFGKTNPDRLAALTASVDRLAGDLGAIPEAFDRHAGFGTGPDLTNLTKLLADIRQKLRRYEPTAEEAEAPADDAGGAEVMDADVGAEPEVRVRASRRGGIDIRSISEVNRRDDAIYLLELASGYFRNNEPSSPLPMLIDRARRLATMDFMDILRDIAPDGLMQAQVIAGSQE
ncbi:MAG TPA: type VI secretion system protein TssA [Rhodopila sp.]|uniref:type VI secretion system protein TssA n=1 Tax=Rhodopila sp. TaxID=2480087 RepID=UPI002CA5356E|nr:type VI secretion system protein TssA [Rhodopila sp.]HVY16861.1 type VI secretion system protein TssA [Rhodopila sp.]